MYPIICKIGPFTIYSYGLLLVVAFLVSSSLANLEAKRKNLNPEIIFNFSLYLLISGIVGGRLFYVIENLGYYLRDPLEIIMLQHGGLSWFGGLILGIFFLALYLKKKNLSIYRTFDSVAPFVALAQAIGRIGCLLNGCCFGKTLIPIQIYSSLALIFIFVILRFLQERPHRDAQIFFAYLIFYSIKRFLIEFWRADHQIIFLGLTLFQILSIIIFFLAGLGYILKCRSTP